MQHRPDSNTAPGRRGSFLLGGSEEGCLGRNNVKKWRKCPWQISETVLFVLSLLHLLKAKAQIRFRDANSTINK
jgi:hypothetical protein